MVGTSAVAAASATAPAEGPSWLPLVLALAALGVMTLAATTGLAMARAARPAEASDPIPAGG
jgi:hypothetical protein